MVYIPAYHGPGASAGDLPDAQHLAPAAGDKWVGWADDEASLAARACACKCGEARAAWECGRSPSISNSPVRSGNACRRRRRWRMAGWFVIVSPSLLLEYIIISPHPKVLERQRRPVLTLTFRNRRVPEPGRPAWPLPSQNLLVQF